MCAMDPQAATHLTLALIATVVAANDFSVKISDLKAAKIVKWGGIAKAQGFSCRHHAKRCARVKLALK